jgi:hypothetical protein
MATYLLTWNPVKSPSDESALLGYAQDLAAGFPAARGAPRPGVKRVTAAHDESAAFTVGVGKVESEIDTRITALHSL